MKRARKKVAAAMAALLAVLIMAALQGVAAFDVASPVFHAIGSVASYSINKLVIDPQREREVFKVWKELRELEKEEAEGGGSGSGTAKSVLPDVVRNKNKRQLGGGELQPREFSTFTREGAAELHGQLGMYGGAVTAFGGQDAAASATMAPVTIDPRIAILTDQCNQTGILTLLFDGFSPGQKLVLYRSRRPAYDSEKGARLPYDPQHTGDCGGTQLGLEGRVGAIGGGAQPPAKDAVRVFMSTEANQRGTAVLEARLRDLRMCDYFAYQALDVASCGLSNIAVLSKHTPVVPTAQLATVSSNPYTYATELDLG